MNWISIRTAEEYIKGSRDRKLLVYYNRRRVDGAIDHPAFFSHIHSAAKICEPVPRPEHGDPLTATSHLKGPGKRHNAQHHQGIKR
ncbi:MAG: hypothetical protein JW950_08085 [Deltaproteobacteria bacterium]|nr:hypothetical protein [Deltaproteobacteria bacterium]